MSPLCKFLPHWTLLWKALCFAENNGLVLSPDPVNFGTTYLSQTSAITLVLLNSDDRKDVSEIAPKAPFLSEPFLFVGGSFPGTGGTCSSSLILTPGQSCTVKVRFLPIVVGAQSSTLAFSYRLQNAPKMVSTTLSGTGALSPALLSILDGSTYDFFQRPVGHTARKMITLQNIGQQTATNLCVVTAPVSPFAFDGGIFPGNGGTCSCSGSVLGGASCTVVLSFAPSTTSTVAGSVSFSFSGAAGPTTLALAGQGQAVQAPGTSDTSYGTGANGIATVDLGSSSEILTSLFLGGDDSLVGGGFAYVGNSNDFVISRYKVNGQLDTSFNGIGSRAIDFSNRQDIVTTVLNDGNGAITLIGYSGSDFAFARVTSNGSLDTGFNGVGTRVLDLNSGSSDFCHSAALDSSGKTVAVGTSMKNGVYSLAVVRLNIDGTLDSTFNSIGKNLATFGIKNSFAYAISVQTDGKMVVGGTSLGTANYDFFVARYGTNGVLDTAFNGTGYLWIDLGNSQDKVTDLTLNSNGSIFLAGRSLPASGDEAAGMAVVKLTSNGTVDTSFATGGVFKTAMLSGLDASAAVRELSTGDLITAWYVSKESSPFYVQLTKLQSNGTLVTSYGTAGTLPTSVRGTMGQRPGLAVQADGKILIGGTVVSSGSGDFAIERHW